ncbi:hypothetical protein L1D13_25280, partial [Vibrio tubiashii]
MLLFSASFKSKSQKQRKKDMIDMYRLLTLMSLIVTTPIFAKEIPVSSPELDDMLKNSTTYGVHYGKKTLQYFSDSGTTWWISSGDKRPSEGTWRVKNNQYCSDFGSGETCYNVVKDHDQEIYYFLKDGFR